MLRIDKVIKPWKESAALNDHINLYGFWNETAFLTKSGDVGMVLRVPGVDYESLDHSEQEYAVKRLEAALKAFSPGFHVYQYLFKSNRPEIPFASYDDPVVEAAIDQRRQLFEAKRDHLYQVEIFYAIVLEGPRSKSGVGAALARLFRDPAGAIGELRTQFTSNCMKTLLRSQIEAALAELELPLPQLNEQLAIANALSSVRLGINKQLHLVKSAQELKEVAMRDLFSHGLRDENQKETEAGPIPETWVVVALGSLGRIGNGSTPKRDVKEYWDAGHYPWLTSAKVYDRLITAADEFVTDEALARCHLPRVKAGSLVMAITGQGKTLGNCALLGIDATVSQHLAYVSLNSSEVAGSYVRGYLETQYGYLRDVASGGGSTKGALTCAFLRELPIPLPPTRKEQQEIADVLDAIDLKIDLHKRKKTVLEELFQSLLHKLMTGGVRVSDLDLSALETAPAVEVTV